MELIAPSPKAIGGMNPALPGGICTSAHLRPPRGTHHPLLLRYWAEVAQLARASGCGPEGHGFEPRPQYFPFFICIMADTSPPSSELVAPETLKGFQDLLPREMILRNSVIRKIQTVYEKFGFLPIDTPVLEYLATLIGTGGEETNKSLFRLDSPEGDPIAMRFDLTVPFARLIAQYPEKLTLPFRRYHIGPVFRVDKPGPGRFRQFTQFDIDAAGSTSVAVDGEIVAAMTDALRPSASATPVAAMRSGDLKFVSITENWSTPPCSMRTSPAGRPRRMCCG